MDTDDVKANETTDETAQLFRDEKPAYYGDDSLSNNTTGSNPKLVLIELVAALFSLGAVMELQISQFYTYERISENNLINETTNGSVCSTTPENDVFPNTENDIQQEASSMFIILLFSSTFPAILPTLYFGTLTAKYGRKLALRCALFGFLIKNVVHIFVYRWKFSLYYLIIGNIIEGLLGGLAAAVVGLFGMVADITPGNHIRSFRMTTVTAALSVAAAFGNGVSGLLIDYVGYVWITIILISLALINLFYIHYFLPETFRASIDMVSLMQSFKQSFSFYVTETEDKRRSKMILCFLSFFLHVGFLLLNMTTMTLFLLNRPFCWTKIHITVFEALRQFLNWVVILIFAHGLRHVISDIGMALAACGSCIVSQIITAFANVEGLIYAAAVIGSLTDLSAPMLRTIMSKLVTPIEQGPLFAGLTVTEVICVTVFNTVATFIYRQTVSIFAGTIFLVVAVVTVIVTILLIMLASLTSHGNGEIRPVTMQDVKLSLMSNEKELKPL